MRNYWPFCTQNRAITNTYVQKANESVRKQQRPAQNQYWMLKTFMINFILIIFWWLEAMLTNRLHRKSTSKKKNSNKAWYRLLGTEIFIYEEFHY